MLEAWQNANKFMEPKQKSAATVSPSMVYTPVEKRAKETDETSARISTTTTFVDVYSKAGDELLKIYSMPIFGGKTDIEDDEGPVL